MSNPSLPPELLDHIVDLLHDENAALRSCCLVSKSWIPRTRKHLFVNIAFCNPGNIQSWKSTFPDPSTSPACYTKSLSVRCPHVVTPADAEENCWIRAFSRVVSFEVMITEEGGFERLVPFHGFSPLIYSLTVAFSPLQPRTFSTSSAHSFFSETWLCSTSVVPLSLRMPTLVGIWP